MKYRLVKPIVFLTAFIISIFAVIIFWQFRQPQIEFQTPSTIQKIEQSPSATTIELSYDKARYDEIKSVIEPLIESKMQENFSLVPFYEVSKSLTLKNVSWDNGCCCCDFFEESRIYHFRGFYLILNVAKRIPGDPPRYSFDDLKQKGVLYLYHFHPALHIDGLNDPKERMRIHKQSLNEGYRKFIQEMEKEKKNNSKK